jgi:hypothetical protein
VNASCSSANLCGVMKKIGFVVLSLSRKKFIHGIIYDATYHICL